MSRLLMHNSEMLLDDFAVEIPVTYILIFDKIDQSITKIWKHKNWFDWFPYYSSIYQLTESAIKCKCIIIA